MKKGDLVVLKSFHGTIKPPEDIETKENYWRLIGSTGVIMSNDKKTHPAYLDKGEQVLVQFKDVEEYHLACHNKIPNSLWIFITDLSDC